MPRKRHTYTTSHTRIHIHTYIHTNIHTYIHTFLTALTQSALRDTLMCHTCVSVKCGSVEFMYVYMHTYIHTYTHLHAHIQVPPELRHRVWRMTTGSYVKQRRAEVTYDQLLSRSVYICTYTYKHTYIHIYIYIYIVYGA